MDGGGESGGAGDGGELTEDDGEIQSPGADPGTGVELNNCGWAAVTPLPLPLPATPPPPLPVLELLLTLVLPLLLLQLLPRPFSNTWSANIINKRNTFKPNKKKSCKFQVLSMTIKNYFFFFVIYC